MKNNLLQSSIFIKFLVVALSIVWWTVSSQPASPIEKSPDLINFWASAKILQSAGNPYQLTNLEHFATAEIPGTHVFSPVFNPPIAFIFLDHLSAFTLTEARQSLLLLSVFCLALYLWLTLPCLSNHAHPSEVIRYVLKTLLIVISLMPITTLLRLGQIDAPLMVALGAALVLSERNHKILAGILLSLTAIKPHLFLLLYGVIFANELRQSYFKIPLGFCSGVAALLIISHIQFPELWAQWLAIDRSVVFGFVQPNIGSNLRLLFNRADSWWVNLMPLIVIFPYVIVKVIRFGSTKNEFWGIYLPLSLIVAPYIWLYDYALLLPSVALIGLSSTSIAPVALLTCAGMLMASGIWPMGAFAWYPILIMLLWHFTHHNHQPNQNR